MRTLSIIVVAILAFSNCICAEDPAALSESAQEAVKTGRYADAEALWQKAINASPRYFPALFNLGLLYHSRKQFSNALPLLEKAAEVSPLDFNTHYLRGACYQGLGRSDDALHAWRTAL